MEQDLPQEENAEPLSETLWHDETRITDEVQNIRHKTRDSF